MRMLSAQSSMEFLVIFMFFIASLVVASWVSLQRANEIGAAKVQLEVDNMLNYLGTKIDTAFLEGSGFSVKVDIPEKLLGSDYSLQVIYNNLYLEYQSVLYTKQLLAQNITGSFATGENIIKNENSVIVIYN
jgi:hypothetical protein